ncbi:hypothetical protein KKF84_11400 [Myxococcota bacterium]|nr:hypothetical protein [Myxococcota bacterium]
MGSHAIVLLTILMLPLTARGQTPAEPFREQPLVEIISEEPSTGESIIPVTRFRARVLVGDGKYSQGTVVSVAFPGRRVGRYVSTVPSRRLPAVGDTVGVLITPAPLVMDWHVWRAGPKDLTLESAPVIAMTESGIPLHWPVRGIHISPGEECPQVVMDAINISLARWIQGDDHSLILISDEPGPTEIGYVTHGTNYNVIKCLYNEWNYGDHIDGLTILTYIDDPGYSSDGLIIDADILLNFKSGGFTTDSTVLHETIAGHELGHLIGMEHPCNTADDFISKNLPGCTGEDLPALSAGSIMFPFSTSMNYQPNEADLEGVALLFPPDDPRPVERVVLEDEGCGCSSPGKRRGDPRGLWFVVLLLVFGLGKAAHGHS